jgi:predicted MFS family arabinose efflux permease
MNQASASQTSLVRLLPLYGVIVIAFLGYSMIVTLFVPMLMHGNSGFLPANYTIAHRTALLGLLLALYPLGQFFGCPILGALSDRFGRKPVLLGSLSITTICYLFICFGLQTKSFLLLAASCLVCGLSESNIAVTQSAVADVTSASDRGRFFAYIYTACSVSYIVGPVVGGSLAERFGYVFPFWIVLGLLVVILFWTRTHFHETHPSDSTRSVDWFGAIGNLLSMFTDRALRQLYLVNFLIYLAAFGFFRAILMYMVDEWHMGITHITLSYAFLAGMSIVASFGLMPLLSKRMDMKTLTVATAILGGLMMIVTIIPRSVDSVFWTAGPTATLCTLTLSACAALLSTSVSEERQGSAMGNNQALQVAAEAGSVFAAGLIAAVLVKLPLIVFGALLVVTALILVPVRQTTSPIKAATET